MEKAAILAITKNGIKIASSIRQHFPDWEIFAPSKFRDTTDATWYDVQTGAKIIELFSKYDAIVCIFSLGAVIRLVAPLLKDKRTDPAVIVIDDKASFVISALSGHLGGANELAQQIADKLGATPVITTAADVNKTIAVDLIGREFGWKIDDDSNVTRISAFMVNDEKIGIYQDCGERNWWNGQIPKNVIMYDDFVSLGNSGCKGFLLISDKILDGNVLADAVVYRPKTLVAGIGLHTNTTKEKILECLRVCFGQHNISLKSLACLSSLKKPQEVVGLREAAVELDVPVVYFDRDELAKISIPNPSQMVQAYEGTPSVSEAAALKASQGELIVEKQKFPPDLTIAVARIRK
ncbi:cobalt-precorrin 5A hydrolase [Candidatus Nitrosotenuis uzonensis]|uniref:Cobalamin (Vitamin B12) biosynthesis CbiG protein n=1 Tax=Candidatus Nitrosotenuis uzonensis TaxID=1407055 RepID=A0A812F4V6_9ARCH|nr:cobalamin biosynthesis protein [Candidatus Nitrosotenuis uzonensis]CAE6488605.1 Cobalamin (Vitamin B12) biosynthesis CbiG protein [Candidatus Nitrosotenuis uzonensis]